MTAFLPRIARPCPLRASERPQPGSDCTRCQRRVHDLDAMSDIERRAFLASCHTSVCVMYTRQVARSALGLGVLAALSAGAVNANPAAQSAEDAVVLIVVGGGTREDPSQDLIDADEDADYRALAGLPTLDDATFAPASIIEERAAPARVDPRSPARKSD